MKKRPSFKVAALESLETRELLSTATSTFRPQMLRASYQAAIKAADQAASTVAGASTSKAAFHVQGGPTATFLAGQRVRATRSAYSTLLNAAIARRAARLTPTTPVASSTPTTLGPSLSFTPPATGSSLDSSPTKSLRSSSLGASTPSVLGGANPTVITKASTDSIGGHKGIIVPNNVPIVAGTLSSTPITTSAATTQSVTSSTPVGPVSVLTQNDVASYKAAVDAFASNYTSGVDISKDAAAITALNSSLAVIGSSAWPDNVGVTQSAVNGLQAQVSAFAKAYTGGANTTTDTAAWQGLGSALAAFSKSAMTTTTTTTATTTSAALASTVAYPTPAAGASVVSPVITGLISGLLSSGTLSANSVKAFQSAVDTFAAGYSSGTNPSGDMVSATNLVTTLNSLAAGQWSAIIAAAPVVTTPVTTTATTATMMPVTTTTTATATPVTTTAVTTAAAPTATTTATPISTTATTSTVTVASTTAASTTAAAASTTASTASTSKAPVTFTAIRAPGV